MKNIKKSKTSKYHFLSALILTLAVMVMITTMTFGVTNSWYAGTLDVTDVSGVAKMGTVEVNLTGPATQPVEPDKSDNTVTVSTGLTDIPIIMRVRVIPELVPDNAGTLNTPDATEYTRLVSAISSSMETSGWASATGAGGLFFIYGADKTSNDYGSYTIWEPGKPAPLGLTYGVGSYTAPTGWHVEVTLIAEALQATQKAYTYTGINGSTMWALN